MIGFISKFILPKQVDFDAALKAQAHTTRLIVDELYRVCVEKPPISLNVLSTHTEQAKILKSKNMKELLDVFITPYDKESIYRVITQLDWIVLSVKHLTLQIDAYEIDSLAEYQEILLLLTKMTVLLEEGMVQLSEKNLQTVAEDIDQIHDQYDHVVELCAKFIAVLLNQDDCKLITMHHDILAQLKDIAKRIHITANTLEDMAIKIV